MQCFLLLKLLLLFEFLLHFHHVFHVLFGMLHGLHHIGIGNSLFLVAQRLACLIKMNIQHVVFKKPVIGFGHFNGLFTIENAGIVLLLNVIGVREFLEQQLLDITIAIIRCVGQTRKARVDFFNGLVKKTLAFLFRCIVIPAYPIIVITGNAMMRLSNIIGKT